MGSCALSLTTVYVEQIGKGLTLVEGKDVALLGYGTMVQNCLRARTLLSKLGIEVTVADARFCKPLDMKLLRQLCKNHAFLVTVEEGSIGGFGSHVSQFIALDGQLDGRTKVIISHTNNTKSLVFTRDKCIVCFLKHDRCQWSNF